MFIINLNALIAPGEPVIDRALTDVFRSWAREREIWLLSDVQHPHQYLHGPVRDHINGYIMYYKGVYYIDGKTNADVELRGDVDTKEKIYDFFRNQRGPDTMIAYIRAEEEDVLSEKMKSDVNAYLHHAGPHSLAHSLGF